MILEAVMRVLLHIVFWIVAMLFLILFTGSGGNRFWASAFTLGLMIPVGISTAYLFNYVLISRFLIQGRYGLFALYATLTVVISIYLEMIIVLLTFIYIAEYQTERMNLLATDIFKLAVGLYLTIFLSTVIYLVRRWSNPVQDVSHISVRSNRQNSRVKVADIEYIESLDNYVKIHLKDESILTKEKISSFQDRLPSGFLRIHRSFLVNQNHIKSFTKEKVIVHSSEIPISRTYKKEVFEILSNS